MIKKHFLHCHYRIGSGFMNYTSKCLHFNVLYCQGGGSVFEIYYKVFNSQIVEQYVISFN